MRFHLCWPSQSNEGRRTIRFIKGDGTFVRRVAGGGGGGLMDDTPSLDSLHSGTRLAPFSDLEAAYNLPILPIHEATSNIQSSPSYESCKPCRVEAGGGGEWLFKFVIVNIFTMWLMSVVRGRLPIVRELSGLCGSIFFPIGCSII
jgi:hypothetical protein